MVYYCEQCGEVPQEIQMQEAGLCLDCFGSTLSEILSEHLTYKPCGRVLMVGELRAICIEPWGSEHDHSQSINPDRG
jgi:hypothetical protein